MNRSLFLILVVWQQLLLQHRPQPPPGVAEEVHVRAKEAKELLEGVGADGGQGGGGSGLAGARSRASGPDRTGIEVGQLAFGYAQL